MIVRISARVGALMAQALAAAFDASATDPGYWEFYAGAMPATPDTALTSQIKLGTVTLSDPCATVDGGTITFNLIVQDNMADAGGVATFVRGFDGDGLVVSDFDVGDMASNAFVKMNTTTVVEGGPILVETAVLTVGV